MKKMQCTMKKHYINITVKIVLLVAVLITMIFNDKAFLLGNLSVSIPTLILSLMVIMQTTILMVEWIKLKNYVKALQLLVILLVNIILLIVTSMFINGTTKGNVVTMFMVLSIGVPITSLIVDIQNISPQVCKIA